MIIANKTLKKIYSSVEFVGSESGGILGLEKGIISHVAFDLGKSNIKCSYEPNVDRLNEVIVEWQKENIQFIGLFHTHFFGTESLSKEDKHYIKEILFAMPDEIHYLYFPIVLPEYKRIIPYSATRYDNMVNIYLDKLTVIYD